MYCTVTQLANMLDGEAEHFGIRYSSRTKMRPASPDALTSTSKKQ